MVDASGQLIVAKEDVIVAPTTSFRLKQQQCRNKKNVTKFLKFQPYIFDLHAKNANSFTADPRTMPCSTQAMMMLAEDGTIVR